jgi:hypothetical protein
VSGGAAFAPRVLDLDGAAHSVNDFPWPYEEGVFTEVKAERSLDRVREPGAVLFLIWKVSAPGAAVHLSAPRWKGWGKAVDRSKKYFHVVEDRRPWFSGRATFRLAVLKGGPPSKVF